MPTRKRALLVLLGCCGPLSCAGEPTPGPDEDEAWRTHGPIAAAPAGAYAGAGRAREAGAEAARLRAARSPLDRMRAELGELRGWLAPAGEIGGGFQRLGGELASEGYLAALVAPRVAGNGELAAQARRLAAPHARLGVRAPADYAGPLRLSLGARDDAGVTLIPRGARAAPAERRLDDGRAVYREVAAGVDGVRVAQPDRFVEALVLRDARAATRFVYELRVGAGITGVRREPGSGDLLFTGAGGSVQLRLRSPVAGDAGGAALAVAASLAGDRLALAVRTGAGTRFPVVLAFAVESAVWQRVAVDAAPVARQGHAAAFDDARGVLVVFGGLADDGAGAAAVFRQDLWEWEVASGRWRDRTPMGDKPEPRAFAAMTYDADRGRLLLFGGRAETGFSFEDTWEWNGADGTWLDRTAAGNKPAARYLHAMAYDRKRKLAVVVGGGAGAPSADGRPPRAFGDMWQLDPATGGWTGSMPGNGPGARSGTGLVWDAARDKLVLFGGLEKLDLTAAETLKQDVWEHDGVAWSERTMAGSKPTARHGFAMAYDGERRRVVVFGGSNISGAELRDDTWEWDGLTGTWAARAPGLHPSGRLHASLGYDPGGRRALLFGGWQPAGIDPAVSRPARAVDELWAWDGGAGSWTDRTPDPSPAARGGHALAYDASSGKVLLFGGYRDTWEWDGRWTRRRPAVSPPARTQHAMSWDPARGGVLLFGGFAAAGGATDDVWEWSSAAGTWTEHQPSPRPLPRFDHVMATDTQRGRVQLFGGFAIPPGPDGGFSSGPRNDLWEWDGATLAWTQRTPAGGPTPPAVRQAAMAYDAGRARLLLLGGIGDMGPLTAPDLWEWDAVARTWQVRSTTGMPGVRVGLGVAWDGARGRLVLFGGEVLPGLPAASAAGTWELDTTTTSWSMQAPATSPPGRHHAPLAYHGGRDAVLVFGGTASADGTALGDTWLYTGPAIPSPTPDGGAPDAPDAAAPDDGPGGDAPDGGPTEGPAEPGAEVAMEVGAEVPPPVDAVDGPDQAPGGEAGTPDVRMDAGDGAVADPPRDGGGPTTDARLDGGAPDAEAVVDMVTAGDATAGGRGAGRVRGGGCDCRLGGAGADGGGPGGDAGAGAGGWLVAMGLAALVWRRRRRAR
jgi:hypothetical protein